jgi:hypothetical protein
LSAITNAEREERVERARKLGAYRTHLRSWLIESHVPEHLHEGLIEYIVMRRPTGSFLDAVLCNNLKEAVGRADVFARPHLHEIVGFLYNHAPAPCWGSPERVQAWLNDPEPAPVVFE